MPEIREGDSMEMELKWIDTIGRDLPVVQNLIDLLQEAACHDEGEVVSNQLIPILLDADTRLQNVTEAADKLWQALRQSLLKEKASVQKVSNETQLPVEEKSDEPDLTDVDFSYDPLEDCKEEDRIHVVLDKRDVNELRAIRDFFTDLVEKDEIEHHCVSANCIHQSIIQQLAKQKEASKADTASTDSEASDEQAR